MTQPIESIDKETALAIHSAAVARFGGLDGVRDKGLLESALAQPFQTFGGEELYPTVAQKAARYDGFLVMRSCATAHLRACLNRRKGLVTLLGA